MDASNLRDAKKAGTELIELYLDKKRYTSLSDKIKGCINLEILSLQENKIT